MQTEKNEQRIIHVVCVDVRRIGRREEDVGRISMVVRVVDGMGRLGRYQQPEQLLMIVIFVRVLVVVPDEPKARQRQPC